LTVRDLTVRKRLQEIDAQILRLRLLHQRQGDTCAARLAARLERERAAVEAGIARPRALKQLILAQRSSG
jgi:hypothetical protein